jgi:hypothetical protein
VAAVAEVPAVFLAECSVMFDLASLHLRFRSLRLALGARLGFFPLFTAAAAAAAAADEAATAAAVGRLEKVINSPPLRFSTTSLASRPPATHSW